jgi:GNAT superfamily N-acetyltransferase
MIRKAIASDIPQIVELGRRSLEDGPYAKMLKHNPEQSAVLALETLSKANGRILVYETDSGKVAGLLGFFVFPHYFTQELTATEIMWYVLPEERKEGGGIKLLWEAEKQAKEMGATRMGFTAANSDVAKLYERFGYREVETTFMKML